jgi:hypothetical protein
MLVSQSIETLISAKSNTCFDETRQPPFLLIDLEIRQDDGLFPKLLILRDVSQGSCI